MSDVKLPSISNSNSREHIKDSPSLPKIKLSGSLPKIKEDPKPSNLGTQRNEKGEEVR